MKVSVIIPAYNSSATIKASLESAIAQSYPVYEIIVVNDGSTDHTEDIIKEVIENNQEASIHYVFKKNAGPSVARNFAIEIATGDLIAFLDSDDVWLKDKLKKQIHVLNENPEYSIIGGLFRNGNLSGKEFEEVSFKNLLINNRFFTSATVVKSSVFDTVKPFREDKKYSEDYNLWLRILATHKGGVLNEKVFTYATETGINNEGLSGNLWLMEKGELDNYKEMYTLNHISFGQLLVLRVYSILKYIRRLIKKQLRK